jgi:hypothetical protein
MRCQLFFASGVQVRCPRRRSHQHGLHGPAQRGRKRWAAAVSIALTRQMLWPMSGQDHPVKAHDPDFE